ncbi:MAG TPA: hypothetical protein VGU90_16535, partial [Terriglobales bacterium]|nr:hypothetical protein [Terriglobales bacterium]
MALLPKGRIHTHGWAPYVWLIFLCFFLFQPVLDHAGQREWLITIGAILVFLPMYFGVFWTGPPINYVLLAGMAAMGIGFAKFNAGSSVFIIFCASFLPWVFSTSKRAFTALAAL